MTLPPYSLARSDVFVGAKPEAGAFETQQTEQHLAVVDYSEAAAVMCRHRAPDSIEVGVGRSNAAAQPTGQPGRQLRGRRCDVRSFNNGQQLAVIDDEYSVDVPVVEEFAHLDNGCGRAAHLGGMDHRIGHRRAPTD
jgi:hypothetical protein